MDMMMQEQLMMLKSREEPTSESVMPPALLAAATRGLVAVGSGGEGKEREGHEKGEKKAATEEEDVKRWEGEEDRAAKIERLKSGFRICQPEGSFIRPKMMSISADDHIVVPTTSSASSLVKPLAERRPISPATLSHVTMSFPPLLSPPPSQQKAASHSHTPRLINLNEAPPNYDPSSCAPPLPYQSSPPPPMQPRTPIAAEEEASAKKEKEMENMASSILERKGWWNVTMHGNGGLP